MRDIMYCLRNDCGHPTCEALHTHMRRTGCRTGKEASHRTGQELVVKSPHRNGCIRRSLVWFFFPFARKPGIDSELLTDVGHTGGRSLFSFC